MDVAWDDDPVVAAWPGLPALEADRRADLCVIGLGGSGLAAVRAGIEAGLTVIGVDAGRVAAGAAGRNGGFLIAGPARAMVDAVRHWPAGCAEWLYRATLAELDDLAATLGDAVVHRVGSIRLAGLPGELGEAADWRRELAECDAEFELLTTLGITVQRYDGPLGQGLFLPSDAAMNPSRRAVEQARALARRAELYEHSRVSAIVPGAVRTPRGTISAGAVVVAVDGRLESLLPQLDGIVRTTRLQMLATAPVPARLPCPVYGRWGYDYAQQDAAGRLFVGGGRDRFVDDEWTLDADPTEPVQRYIESVAERMAGQPVQVTHRWGASVGYTTDGRAVCVEVEPGVVACGGYSGTGNLVGPVAARAAVALAIHGTPPPPCFRSSIPSAERAR